MADELERPVDDLGEQHGEPHLPSPTIWPFAFAAGIALVLVGLIVSWALVAVGAGIAVVFGCLWVREATREVRGAPPPEPTSKPSLAELEEEAEPHVAAAYPRSKFL